MFHFPRGRSKRSGIAAAKQGGYYQLGIVVRGSQVRLGVSSVGQCVSWVVAIHQSMGFMLRAFSQLGFGVQSALGPRQSVSFGAAKCCGVGRGRAAKSSSCVVQQQAVVVGLVACGIPQQAARYIDKAFPEICQLPNGHPTNRLALQQSGVMAGHRGQAPYLTSAKQRCAPAKQTVPCMQAPEQPSRHKAGQLLKK